jgi:gamma-glutamyltranspeptidase/glutathione hydrolase
MHLVIEAQRRGFVDRFQHLGDPDFAPVPTEGIVSKEFAAQRRATIDLNQATPLEGAGDPWPFERERKEAVMAGSGVPGGEGNTTHFTVIDGDRNMVSCVSTLGGHFGSAVINPGAGVVLNNGVMWFDPEPGSLVTVGPGKRIMTAGSPVLVLDKDGQPFLTIGAPGGRRVISAIFQSLVNVLDYGMGPAEAIGSPRSHCEGSGVEIDNRVPERTLEGLRRRGHDLDVREESLVFSNFARPNGIMVDPVTGALRGGVTPFGPATAVGL